MAETNSRAAGNSPSRRAFSRRRGVACSVRWELSAMDHLGRPGDVREFLWGKFPTCPAKPNTAHFGRNRYTRLQPRLSMLCENAAEAACTSESIAAKPYPHRALLRRP